MISEHQLRQDVLDELDFEPSVNAAHIGVGVNAGVVTLTGFVSSYREKLAAERAARRVKGVKAIAEGLEVRLPSDKKTADDEIAGRAVDILKWRVGFPADRISIKVEKGIVTLTGDVDWQFQKTEAEAAIHHLSGVVGVVNLVQLRSTVHDSEVKEKNSKGATAERGTGRVTDHRSCGRWRKGGSRRQGHAWYERDLAEQAAWAAPGVTAVVDYILIEP
jgi:osmotically-inducible protein OsmY